MIIFETKNYSKVIYCLWSEFGWKVYTKRISTVSKMLSSGKGFLVLVGLTLIVSWKLFIINYKKNEFYRNIVGNTECLSYYSNYQLKFKQNPVFNYVTFKQSQINHIPYIVIIVIVHQPFISSWAIWRAMLMGRWHPINYLYYVSLYYEELCNFFYRDFNSAVIPSHH